MDFRWNQTPAWETFVPPESIAEPWIESVAPPDPQSESQPNMINQPGETANEARKYAAKDWVTQKAEIARLYESNGLEEVRTIMRERHGLIATPKQYKDRIAKWGLEKNIKTGEMEAIIRKQQERALQGKRSAFRVRKKPVASKKIARYMKEHHIPALDANEDMNMDWSMDVAATPKAISCYTPSELGPPTPRAAPSPEASSNLYTSANLQPSLSYGSPHWSSYQFGDPTIMLPNSPSVAQMTGTFHRRPLLPMSMASPPVPFLNKADEIAFTEQRPAPLSVPPNFRQYLQQEEGLVITHREGSGLTESHTSYLAQDHGAQPLPNTSTPSPPSSIGTDLLQGIPGEGDEFETNIDAGLLTSASIHGDRIATRLATPPLPPAPPLKHKFPEYIKPPPQRMTPVDIDYLFWKGALSLPEDSVRNALLRSYLEYVHPYMPLIEAHELLQIINNGTGATGRISLLLFQAIMFTGTTFVDMEYLRAAGYSNRKVARKAFFQKARVLYDFEYEIDRITLVQSLLLMTYWYETPDDAKDTWHWMGVAISLANTIGLHRNPNKSNMELHKKKLWKRIWWSCFMRDRLVALSMRRPTRVKDEDYDVPMLTEDDFEVQPLSKDITIIPMDCTLVRDVEAQRQLAQMCIAKAKLCLCISHVLSAQYLVLVKHQGMEGQEGSTGSSVMMFPKKLDQTDEVKRCDVELSDWIAELPASCSYSNELIDGNSGSPLFVQRSLLHMLYFTTLSALHRPQVLPSAATSQLDSSRELQDLSRKKLREASREVTRISQDLDARSLATYLPTTGVTVLLPAIIIHLLDIKSCNDETRQAAMDGFSQCMLVLEKLRDNYASADFATQFLEAAIWKADIDVVMPTSGNNFRQEGVQAALSSDKDRELRQQARVAVLRRTPPPSSEHDFRPDMHSSSMMDIGIPTGRPIDPVHNAISAHTPPDGDTTMSTHDMNDHSHLNHSMDLNAVYNMENFDLNDFFNFDNWNETWNVPLEGAHGESGGFLDPNLMDQAPGWSRLNSPERDIFAQPGKALA